MREIPLTQGYVALADDEDYEWLSQWRWTVLVRKGRRYAYRGVFDNGKRVASMYMHRQILGLPPRAPLVDHADHNGLNNQRGNLRIATNGQNIANQQGVRAGSGYRGVYSCGNIWRAAIGAKSRHLGTFPTSEEAARAYDKAAFERWGEFASLNFPNG